LTGEIIELPAPHELRFRTPLGSQPDAKFLAIRINDDAFGGDLRRGRVAYVEEKFIQLPGLHAAKFVEGLIVVRYAIEKPGGGFRLRAANPEYPEFDETEARLLGRVVQMPLNARTGERWELTDDERLARLRAEWLVELYMRGSHLINLERKIL
jgi:hypothetical protein